MIDMIPVSFDSIKGFTQVIKSIVTFAQKYESIVKKKLDELMMIQNQLYQLQQEKQQLKDEVARLEDLWKQEQDVEEHPTQPFIIFKSDPKQIKYCANCWHERKIKTRFYKNYRSETLVCPRCQTVLCTIYDAGPPESW